ncbi:MAG: WecB/TagA/CpsF family glycosyltransferase [Vallitaleaceae bacterium]|jgi:N-acetylglucosaminyldiphosphoundecaprenol N-acetyl-beta-D-mannosaminyltransferase|nr:WecB/TagA/CpsF family glycosyltransferase [Vallitaleaceae bacterium]
MKRVDVLGIKFNHITMDESVEAILSYMGGSEQKTITTANPEIVMMARKDQVFKQLINSGQLTVADGIGVVIGSRILGCPLPERVAGYDLFHNVFDRIKGTDYKVYFLGAAPGIAAKAARNMRLKFEGLQVVGVHDGYFELEDTQAIIDEINEKEVDLVLVGLGAPKQERWIEDYGKRLNAKVLIGVGGSFDGMSGTVKRAPDIFIKLGLEWFHRLITQPSRARRMLQLPLFILVVIGTRIRGVFGHGI